MSALALIEDADEDPVALDADARWRLGMQAEFVAMRERAIADAVLKGQSPLQAAAKFQVPLRLARDVALVAMTSRPEPRPKWANSHAMARLMGRPGGRTAMTPERDAEARRLAREGVSTAAAARAIGVPRQTLVQWAKYNEVDFRDGRGKTPRPCPVMTPEREALARECAENGVSQRETARVIGVSKGLLWHWAQRTETTFAPREGEAAFLASLRLRIEALIEAAA